MKKTLLALCAALLLSPLSHADEGMWLLPLLEKLNSETMQNLGSRLTPEQIYSVNEASIKDAVVQFGGGCTGEIISPNGLLVTNHHCGYSYIQALSSEENNYLENGFWAMNRKEEIPVPGLKVRFLQEMVDVTDIADNDKKLEKKEKELKKKHPHCTVSEVSFFNNNSQYLVVYKTYSDVRFVGAPPASSGKFGGDTDNWMWPRHTCDFSMFRVYADGNNEPADYSESNIPLSPKKFLSISLKGVEEGDFAMIMGYPGTTRRYQTAAQLEDMLATNDIRIEARGIRQDILWKEMRADEKVGLQYASKYAGSSNGWKKWIGMKESFEKLNVLGRQIEKEDALRHTCPAIDQIATLVKNNSETNKEAALLTETLGRIELLSFARSNEKGNIIPRKDGYKDYNSSVDKKVALALTEHYLNHVGEEYKVNVSLERIEKMFDESVFTSLSTLEAAQSEGKDLSSDPAAKLSSEVREMQRTLFGKIMKAQEELPRYTKEYGAALINSYGDKALYPDANGTCRLTYGTVKGYEPKDAVVYKYYTTLKGVMEKENPANYEFRVPEKLKEIYNTKNYGDYANDKGEVVACFLANLDITGGNSGSPVMDADGNLIGLAFDGNWEAMSGDIIFEPELQRCICVDIRYVLLMMDKFGGAGYLLDEMNLVK